MVRTNRPHVNRSRHLRRFHMRGSRTIVMLSASLDRIGHRAAQHAGADGVRRKLAAPIPGLDVLARHEVGTGLGPCCRLGGLLLVDDERHARQGAPRTTPQGLEAHDFVAAQPQRAPFWPSASGGTRAASCRRMRVVHEHVERPFGDRPSSLGEIWREREPMTRCSCSGESKSAAIFSARNAAPPVELVL